MKKRIFIILTIIACTFTGCGSSVSQEEYDAKVKELESIQEELNAKTKELESMQEEYNTKTKELESVQEELSDMTPSISEEEESSYPSTVSDFHERYNTIINNYFSEFTLSDISEESYGESVFYSFNLYIGNNYSHPKVTFQNESSNFQVSLPDEIENSTLKEVIKCTVMVLQEDIDETTATDITQTIVNGFNGIEDSPITSIDNYKLYISANPGFTQRYFEIVNNNEINTLVDISKYPEVNKEVFNGALNQGSKAMLKGTVSNMVKLGIGTYELEVNCGSDVYVVYFNFNSFIDCFAIGEEYTFYGTIAAQKTGYAGCLRLDYVV